MPHDDALIMELLREDRCVTCDVLDIWPNGSGSFRVKLSRINAEIARRIPQQPGDAA